MAMFKKKKKKHRFTIEIFCHNAEHKREKYDIFCPPLLSPSLFFGESSSGPRKGSWACPRKARVCTRSTVNPRANRTADNAWRAEHSTPKHSLNVLNALSAGVGGAAARLLCQVTGSSQALISFILFSQFILELDGRGRGMTCPPLNGLVTPSYFSFWPLLKATAGFICLIFLFFLPLLDLSVAGPQPLLMPASVTLPRLCESMALSPW